jgi:RimJ/RimL family protein N-acetyltransferase
MSDRLPDPMDALQSFQDALNHGRILVLPALTDRNLCVHFDRPDENPRLTCVRVDGRVVTAFVEFVVMNRGDIPCFQIGYAVPEAYRNQGRATEIVQAGLTEMQHIFASFIMQAVVGVDNKPSQRVAEHFGTPTATTDEHTGAPVYFYSWLITPIKSDAEL